MSAGNCDRILRGPPVGEIPDCSLAEYVVPRLRSLPKDHVLQVEDESGAVQTGAEFLSRSIRLSEGLKRMGLKENDVVGLLCRNCFAACEVVLATWLSGAIISPVPGSLKLGEMKHLIGLTKPKFIFAEEEAMNNVKEAVDLLQIDATIISTGDIKDAHPTLEDVLIDVDVDRYRPQPLKLPPADQVAAILPSSGTSGLQKGVCITHRNLIFQDLNMNLQKFFDLRTDCMQISHFFWVTGLLLFIRALSAGMKRILTKSTNTSVILKAIEDHKPEWTFMAPLFLLSITNNPDFEKYDVSSLKCLVVGGSPYTQSIHEVVKAKWTNVRIIQAYGTTEGSGSLCLNDDSEEVYSLGKVTPGVQLKIVDTATGELLQSNAMGEICFMSPGIMKGYLNNEAATKESKDPEGWIHTGDLGYYDDSKRVYLVDRIKEMVKVMGMHVSPGELESVILSVPGILQAGVVGVTIDDRKEQCHLMALVVKEKNSSVTEEDIHSHIAESLSDYKKLTGGVLFVESLPMTPSGKLRRSELKKMAEELISKV